MTASNAHTTSRPLRFIVIGAGLSGILALIRLREAGFTDVTVYEKASGPGGTWRDNTYPGVACDIPSHLYSYSFAPNPQWSRMYAPGAEIQSYIKSVIDRYQIDRHIRYGQEIRCCEFSNGRWQIETASSHRDIADVIIAATGVSHHPRMPAIPGSDTFEGEMFHSSRWNHAVAIDGQRVGIIGTGASSVQLVSALIDRVSTLTLFQRTAQWIFPQENREFTAEERLQFQRQPEVLRSLCTSMMERFTDNFSNAVIDAASPQMRAIEAICRENLETQVRDPLLRERLRPKYRAGCKRLVTSPNFYQSIQKHNAVLVDAGIERIELAGVRARDGRLHELDVLILATGFQTHRFMRPMTVIGRDGLTLDAAWTPRPYAYMTVSIPGFPNFFMLNGPASPVGNFSLIDTSDLQMSYLLQLFELLRTGRCSQISPSAESTTQFEAMWTEAAKNTIWSTGCTNWFLDDRGIPLAWPWSIGRFQEAMSAPVLAAYELA